ncbi:MAG: tetratricopeptide repeat protein [Verrucomicrobiales bacterium]|nr:tetratricopeptide repeat protein [Verrucomicrobiales bacterium]
MKMIRLAITTLVWTVIALSQGMGQETTADAEVLVSPVDLLQAGRLAFQKGDFAVAEKNFARFFSDYGEHTEAQEAVKVHRPLYALSKVGIGKYAEALVLIEQSLQQGAPKGDNPKGKASVVDELKFWRGICLMQAQDWVAAQEAFGEYWSDERHEPFKRYEALLLFAHLYLMQGFAQEAADFLKEQTPKMRSKAPDAMGRAVVLRLHALLQLDDGGHRDEALRLLRSENADMGKITQLISFQFQILDLGARFLEQQEYRKAILCLQRVWTKRHLLDHQQQRLLDLQSREAVLAKQKDRQAARFQIRAIIRRVERELERLKQVEDFDSGLRLRLAMAFQAQERYREAALVMQQMLQNMPADEVVESASLALMQCWMKIERWPKVIAAADLYEQKFAQWDGVKHLPEVLFLKAEAYKESQQAREAAAVYGQIAESFPKHPQAPAALFMQAYMYLVQDDSEGAVYHFDLLRKSYPDHALVEDADYWTAMALSFVSDYETAEKKLQQYAEKYGEQGKYAIEAQFRLAYCVFAQGEHRQAVHGFGVFIKNHAEHDLVNEARLLLGDAFLAEGEIEAGVAAYRKVEVKAKRFFEDAWFKIGKALRLTGQLDKMTAHFEGFLQDHPESLRMPEAVYWLGWVDRQNDDLDRAKQRYWQVLKTHGDDRDLLAIEDLVAALPKLYRDTGEDGDEKLLAELAQLKTLAEARKLRVLALRCGWAIAQVHRGRDEKSYRVALIAATAGLNAKKDPTRIVVDCAQAQLEMGNLTVAEALFEQVRKWHPAAVQRDLVFAGLAKIAQSKGAQQQAIFYLARAERATASPQRLADLKLRRASLLLALMKPDEAKDVLDSLLEDPGGSSRHKALALFASGELLMSIGELRKASAYYERIYVVYGKYRELVAKSYWRRGEVLEQMDLSDQAMEVYSELVEREDLRKFEVVALAEKKLQRLQKEGAGL